MGDRHAQNYCLISTFMLNINNNIIINMLFTVILILYFFYKIVYMTL